MRLEQPYHDGERQVQARAGEVAGARHNGRAVADSIVRGALPFLARQPMVVAGSAATDGALWASVLFGEPGFLSAPDPRTVELDPHRMAVEARDPFWRNIQSDPRVGLLAIELSTRRRLRINGPLYPWPGTDRLRLDVVESYPNCPKYIQRRHLKGLQKPADSVREVRQGTTLGEGEIHRIRRTDTLFVASAHPDPVQGQLDASHRGGPPGFVEVLGDRTLRVPDYAGNSMFNTLGNLQLNPRAGLAFLDFEGGRTLQLTGRAEIRWDLDDPAGVTGGTRRFWDFHLDRWLELPVPVAMEWEFLEASPHLPHGGQG
jgi:predicted pyridoxine 5'-phosphate oxidase superfamily flavin-nucleotide-binding protein